MTKKNNNNNRLKVTTACQNCQRRKIKCSGEMPCSYCTRFGRRCEPGKPGKKRGPPPGQEMSRRRMDIYYSAGKDLQMESMRSFNYEGLGDEELEHQDNTNGSELESSNPFIHGNEHQLPTIKELGVFDNGPPLRRPIPIYPVHMKARQTGYWKNKRQDNSDRPCFASDVRSSERGSTVWTKVVPRTTTSQPLVNSKGSSSSTSSSSMRLKKLVQNLPKSTITLPPLVQTVSTSVNFPLVATEQELQPGVNVSLNQKSSLRSTNPTIQSNLNEMTFDDRSVIIISDDEEPNEPNETGNATSRTDNNPIERENFVEKTPTSASEADQMTIIEITSDENESENESSDDTSGESRKRDRTAELEAMFSPFPRKRMGVREETSSSDEEDAPRRTRPINNRRRYIQRTNMRITRNAAREAATETKKWVRRRD